MTKKERFNNLKKLKNDLIWRPASEEPQSDNVCFVVIASGIDSHIVRAEYIKKHDQEPYCFSSFIGESATKEELVKIYDLHDGVYYIKEGWFEIRASDSAEERAEMALPHNCTLIKWCYEKELLRQVVDSWF